MFLLISTLISLALSQNVRPNIVILFADDLGYGDLRNTGNPSLKTPNLWKMGQEGLTLTNWYSGSPLCTPSRACLMTGRLAVRTGMTNPLGGVLPCDGEFGLPTNETTLAEHLKAAGYKTGHVGKWHLGQRPQYLPRKRGFDSYFGIPFSVDMGGLVGHPHPTGCTNLPLFQDDEVIQQPVDLDTLAEKYAKAATSFIEENKKDPFFLYMAFSHVHVTITPVIQYAGPKFRGTSERGPFGDAVEELDWIVGQIMSQLITSGVDKNTIVFFTSDNGPWLEKRTNAGSEGLFTGTYAHTHFGYTDTGKGSTWEGGIREAAIVRWPGKIVPGSLSNQITSTMDIFTTSLVLAGAPVPKDRVIDGKDISEVLFHDGRSPHDFLFLYRGATLFAVRHEGFKVHFKTKSGFGNDPVVDHNPPLLFNVEVDPSEEFPLNTEDYKGLLRLIDEAVAEHKKHVEHGKDQISAHSHIYGVCCNHSNGCVCGQ